MRITSKICLLLLLFADFSVIAESSELSTNGNFVVESGSSATDLQIGAALEASRLKISKEWLGDDLPRWLSPVRVDVQIKNGPRTSSGATVRMPVGDGAYLTMMLEGPLDDILANGVPHEVAHCVIFHYFRCRL